MDTPTNGIVAFPTALGTCAVRWTALGIASVRLPSARTADLPRAAAVAVPEPVQKAIDGIAAVLDGSPVDLRFVRLDDREVDEFRRSVYAATRTIPAGATATYGEVARMIGHAEMAREVGAGLARNPFPIVVPCHRIIGADGKLTGFSAPGGLATKSRMLEIEGAPGFGQQSLFG
jgi:methylated-DNA-[protein]-cysteine S-methyltransferase